MLTISSLLTVAPRASSRDLSLRLWRLFLPFPSTDAASSSSSSSSSSLPGGELSLSVDQTQSAHLYCTQYRHPSSPLDVYIAELSAPLNEFIAHLHITTRNRADFGVSELMKLATMPNLGVLEIIEQPGSDEGRYGQNAGGHLNPQQVSDRLVRGWSLTRPYSFPALRVLRLWGCDSDILTPACLQYAAGFPLLAHFDVSVHYDSQHTMAGPWSGILQTASTSGWAGFALQELPLPAYNALPAESGKNTKSVVLTLNKVEEHSLAVDALRWGSRLYSFLANYKVYDATTVAERRFGVATGPINGHFASMTLGGDLGTRHHALSRGDDSAFRFIRTRDALALKAESKAAAKCERRKKREQLHPTATAKRRKAGKSIGSMLNDFTT